MSNNNNNNKNKNAEVISSADIANVLKHSPETKAAEEAIAAKDAVREETQQRALVAAQSTPTRQSRSERAADRIHEHLETLVNVHYEKIERSKAWSSIVDIITRYPNNSVFEAIYKCFVQNKNNPNLNEMYALATITNLESEMVMKVRFLYTVMNGLTHGHYTRKSLNMDVLRSTFGNDEFVNWIAMKLRPNRR